MDPAMFSTRTRPSGEASPDFSNKIQMIAISPEKASIPIHFESDKKCLDACARTTGIADFNDLKVVRIINTASLKHLQVSRSLEKEVLGNSNMSLVTPWQPFTFNESGNLPVFFPDE